MVAVVILLWVLARMPNGENKLSNVRSFIILRSGEGVTVPPLKVTVLTFLVKSGKMKLSGAS